MMNREHLEELMSRSLDGELTVAEQATLDQALAGSESLRELAADLAAIHRLAQRPAPGPSAAAGERIAGAVAQTYARNSRSRFQPLLAIAAITLAVIGLSLWVSQPQIKPEMDLVEAGGLEDLNREIEQAQERYHAAVAQLETVAIAHMETLPPETAFEFAAGLRNLNRAIADCERMAAAHHDDHFVYASLSRAYQAKVAYLQRVLES